MPYHTDVVNNIAVRPALNPASYGTGAAYSSFLDVRGYEQVEFVVHMGASTGTVPVTLYENTSASSSGATAVTDRDGNTVTATFTATDDNKQIILAVDVADITKRYVGFQYNPAAASTLLQGTMLLTGRFERPVPNGTAENIAFVYYNGTASSVWG
jgi:hypothetical protein